MNEEQKKKQLERLKQIVLMKIATMLKITNYQLEEKAPLIKFR